jgi:hypothetical protein
VYHIISNAICYLYGVISVPIFGNLITVPCYFKRNFITVPCYFNLLFQMQCSYGTLLFQTQFHYCTLLFLRLRRHLKFYLYVHLTTTNHFSVMSTLIIALNTVDFKILGNNDCGDRESWHYYVDLKNI